MPMMICPIAFPRAPCGIALTVTVVPALGRVCRHIDLGMRCPSIRTTKSQGFTRSKPQASTSSSIVRSADAENSCRVPGRKGFGNARTVIDDGRRPAPARTKLDS